MWLPPWLGTPYSRLFFACGLRAFSYREAKRALGEEDSRARLVLSRLRRSGYLVNLDRRGRRRVYRLLDPSTLVFCLGAGIAEYWRIQGRYVQLVLNYARGVIEAFGGDLISMLVYGSVARRIAGPYSDIDILMIIDGLDPDYHGRMDRLVDIELGPSVQGEMELLEGAGFHVAISPIAMKPEEAKGFRWLYLDIIEDGILLLDRGGFFSRLSDRIRKRLKGMGARRVFETSKRWYWDLKPDLKVGEVIAP